MSVMLNWLVVGLGDVAVRRVVPGIQEDPRSHLYGVVTSDPAKGSRYAAHVWSDLEPALADPQVQAVYLATPVFLHAPQTLAALRAGKHVLCEKPMAMNYAEACAMVEAARASQGLLGVAYYRRCYPKVLRARDLLAQGAIGRPVLAEINCHNWFAEENGFRGWLLDPERAGGGPLYDVGSHRIDVLNFLFGRPLSVTAQLSNAVLGGEVEDSATVLIEYETGVRGVVDVRRHSHLYRDEFRVLGTDGEMELSPLNGPALVYPGASEELPNHTNFHAPYIAHFAGAVLDGNPLVSTGETAIWTDWVTEQALISAGWKRP